LRVIFEKDLLRKGGVIFFHDVEWPWARRDMYYQISTIPQEYRQNCGEAGIVRGRSELLPKGGDHVGTIKAISEGGKRNGVLTAIEDFLRDDRRKYRFFRVRAGSGLGILQYRGGFRDGLTFYALAGKGFIYGTAYRVLRLAKQVFCGGFRRDTL
jgi:hypothetical protein